MAIDFPTSPTNGQVFTSGDKTWAYSTSVGAWQLQAQTVTGPTGNTGADGSWATTQLIRSITGTTDTPTSADNGKLVTIDTASSGVTITINSSLGLSTGQRIDFAWLGAATSANFASSNTTVNGTPGLELRTRYSAATLLCVGSNSYLLVGDLSA